jgi:hypothetical protein
LLLARYGKEGQPETMVGNISQETLAELVGTTRGRVNFFMNKFRKLGFIHYNGPVVLGVGMSFLTNNDILGRVFRANGGHQPILAGFYLE